MKKQKTTKPSKVQVPNWLKEEEVDRYYIVTKEGVYYGDEDNFTDINKLVENFKYDQLLDGDVDFFIIKEVYKVVGTVKVNLTTEISLDPK